MSAYIGNAIRAHRPPPRFFEPVAAPTSGLARSIYQRGNGNWVVWLRVCGVGPESAVTAGALRPRSAAR
jgi:hypothetical protein